MLQFAKKASQCICSGGFISQHLCQTSNNPVGALRPACAHRPAAAATMKRAHRVSAAAAAAASNAEAAIQTADPHAAFTLPPSPGCARLQRSVSGDPQNPAIDTKNKERATQRVRRGSALEVCTWPSESPADSSRALHHCGGGEDNGVGKSNVQRKEERGTLQLTVRCGCGSCLFQPAANEM